MTPRLQSQKRKFFTPPLSRKSQKRLETKPNIEKRQENLEVMLQFLIHRTWAIGHLIMTATNT